MTRRRFWIPAIPAVAALSLVGYAIAHPTVSIGLTRDQVQERIDAKLPIAGTRMGVSYEIARARVELRGDGRIGIDADVTASALNRVADVTLVGSGEIEYADGEFYLSGFRLEKAVPRAVDPALVDEEEPQGRIGTAIRSLALRDRAARALENAGSADGAAFLTAGRDAVVGMARDRGSELVAGALSRHPVYRLREGDVRQSLAKLALRDVRVEDGRIVADLNVMAAFVRILLWAMVAVLAAAAALALLVAFPAGAAIVGLASP